ncbi:hypothetical protein CYMTET_43833 [Cymbomonas tetramitiformis]|uniref:Uncharacterized protein n=1 Tax=Cymbomonas tetramitiformis TaxID=36881 RepID=A0AAE0F090_9CHLO|nr:hypothetical protein CYMTET_43833 [Cymbomonas tetramitiformis]
MRAAGGVLGRWGGRVLQRGCNAAACWGRWRRGCNAGRVAGARAEGLQCGRRAGALAEGLQCGRREGAAAMRARAGGAGRGLQCGRRAGALAEGLQCRQRAGGAGGGAAMRIACWGRWQGCNAGHVGRWQRAAAARGALAEELQGPACGRGQRAHGRVLRRWQRGWAWRRAGGWRRRQCGPRAAGAGRGAAQCGRVLGRWQRGCNADGVLGALAEESRGVKELLLDIAARRRGTTGGDAAMRTTQAPARETQSGRHSGGADRGVARGTSSQTYGQVH